VELSDVTPLSLGIESHGGIMSVLIPRNTPIPTRKVKGFTTSEDNQRSVTVPLYEGERTRTCDNNLLGSFMLTGIPPAPRGVPQFTVCFDIDANGILNVFAEDKITGIKTTMSIANSKERFSEADIDRLVKEAEKYKLEDTEHMNKMKSRNSFEKYVYEIRDTVTSLGGKIAFDDKKKIEDAVENAIRWLDINEVVGIHEANNQMKELESVYNPIVMKMYGQGSSSSSMGANISSARFAEVD